MASERLQKIIAQSGLTSRRDAEKLIAEGRVKVNGQVVSELGSKADPKADTISVEGHGRLSRPELVYIALHKPIHVVTTTNDPEGRQTVTDVLAQTRAMGKKRFEGFLPRVFPIGRLDFDAEGLLLLSNDGEMANRLTHPRHHVPKTYVVKVKGRPEARGLERMRRGIRLIAEPGRPSRRTAPAEVRVLRNSPANTWLEIVLTEGRNHQVKRMCQAVGLRVLRLIRTEFAGVSLDPLPTGAWRFLSAEEVSTLRGWKLGSSRTSR